MICTVYNVYNVSVYVPYISLIHAITVVSCGRSHGLRDGSISPPGLICIFLHVYSVSGHATAPTRSRRRLVPRFRKTLTPLWRSWCSFFCRRRSEEHPDGGCPCRTPSHSSPWRPGQGWRARGRGSDPCRPSSSRPRRPRRPWRRCSSP